MNTYPDRPIQGFLGLKNIIRRFFKNSPGEFFLQKMNLEYPNAFWKKLIPPHYLYRPGSIRKTTINRINYSFDISNQADHFIYFGQEEPGYRSIENDIRKAQTIFDIGANNATSSLFFANLNTDASILAFEPHPATYENALENIALNSFTNIRLFNFGLGNANNSVQLYEVDPTNNGMNRVLPINSDYPSTEIHIRTLDSFIDEEKISAVSLLKIDVEGYEYQVLKGGEQSLKKYLPLLFIELDDDNLKNNKASAAELISLLLEFGYKEFKRAHDSKPVSIQDDFTGCHYDIIARFN